MLAIILIAVSAQILPLIIFLDSRDPIFSSRDPNLVLKHPRKTVVISNFSCLS